MSTTTHVVATVSELAAGQWGLLTTAQADREGVTRLQLARLTEAAILERVDRGVYATTSSPTEHRALRAAWLALDPSRTAEERLGDPLKAGVASHTSAAGLHRLGDLLDDTPELTTPYRKQSRRGIRLHRLSLTDQDITLVDGLPTTTVERTIADLLRDGHDPEHVAQIIGEGARRGVINLEDLAAQVEPSARRYRQPDGHALVEHLLDLVGLSPAALARDLANSTAGKELVAAGHRAGAASAFSALAASLASQLDTAHPLGLNKVAIGAFADINLAKIIDVSKIIDVTSALYNVKALKTPVSSILGPQLLSTHAFTNTPTFRAALSATQPTAARAPQQLPNFNFTKEPTRPAATSRTPDSEGGE
ncbi:type IV toxin-antitoxin system AbiEi family antitoxin domain-containing protein [Georgenia faecalis]|uniref:type IV toxin-antitoxin system AbiEi family antitoxin domain-containing protein n=1 Tax=Georgenia faecalis TaxID=2483799 RepID=UPI000FD88DF8|nr:type IV toxin-antitoxin system AbiEi family antitoxin domain-containing protein [Georgenia faecalis]